MRTARSMAALTLAALLATAVWPASAARAADDSNIPGVPLPGSVVTGSLGGPIYDRVYAIDVPADRVILLALSGDAGTDFDLYLFDARATTVYGTDGLVASSTTSTSTESVTYATRSGGRFYIDLNGATATQGTFRLTVKVAADATAPHAELRFNDGAVATPDSTIRVTLVATDDLSGVTDMQFSADGERWDEWREYQPLTLWGFPQVDGVRRLWARVRDRSGNVSAIATAAIAIDSVNPSVISRSPGPGDEVTSPRPVFRVRFSEAILPASWLSQGVLVQDPAGTTVAGTYAYDDGSLTGSFTPAGDLSVGAAYYVTLGAIADLAGNPVAPLGTWVVRPVRVSTVTLSADPRSATYGSIVTLHGHVGLPVDGSINLERSVAGGPWAVMAALRPDEAGDLTIRTPATANAAYRLHVAASPSQTEEVSTTAAITVRRAVALPGVSSSVTRRIAAGTAVSLRAQATPSLPDGVITVTIYRYNTVKRAYEAAGTIRRSSVGGVAAFTWKPTVRGSYYLRLSTFATTDLAAGVSTAYRWMVT